jgi:hypothetical protein
VAGLYEAHTVKEPFSTHHILSEMEYTRPLSVVMAEKLEELRAWARNRTVPAN